MKKTILSFMFAIMFSMALSSCGNGTTGASDNIDTLTVDSVEVVDTVAVDSVSVDTVAVVVVD